MLGRILREVNVIRVIRKMQKVHDLDRLDFLLVVEAVLTHKTITKAADHLGVSQSALSHSLVRLRARFKDPLFVRSGGVMQPTPLVSSFAEPLARSLAIIRSEVLGAARFDPATTQRVFKVCVTEIGAFLLVPRLIRLLRERAPLAAHAPMDINRAEIPAALESGSVDVPIGHFPELRASLYQQHLFTRSYSAIVRADHPMVRKKMTPKQFNETPLVRCTSTVAINQWLDRHFAKAGRTQAVGLETPYIMALGSIVGATDWMAFVPDELIEPLKRLAPVRPVDVPLPVPKLAVKQHWHRRYKGDEASRFIRGVVYDALRE
jgi:DNA-binding transcriptional LysR family regulator